MNRPGCSARAESDQMYCARCGLRWDNNSIDPPECLTELNIIENNVRALPNGSTFSDAVPPVSQEEQAEINRRGMALLRETLSHE